MLHNAVKWSFWVLFSFRLPHTVLQHSIGLLLSLNGYKFGR